MSGTGVLVGGKPFRLLKKMPRYGSVLLLTVVAGILEGIGLSLFVPLINLADGGEQENGQFDYLVQALDSVGLGATLWTLTILVMIVLIGAFFAAYLQRVFLSKSRLQYQKDIRDKLAEDILDTSWSETKKASKGKLINLLTVQVDRASAGLNYYFLSIAFGLQTIIYLFVSMLLSFELTIMVTALLAVLALGANVITNNVTQLGQRSVEAHVGYSERSAEYISGLKVIKVMAAQSGVYRKLEQLSTNIFGTAFNEEKSHSLLAFYMRAGPIALIAAIIIVSFEILEISGSVVLVFLFVMMRMVPSVSAVRQNFHSFRMHRPSMLAVEQALSRTSDIGELNDSSSEKLNLEHGISLNNVSFRYDGNEEYALRSINIDIPKNKTIGIVGTSGAGKSTLLDILVGLERPTDGEVLIDGKRYSDEMELRFRRSLGYVTQDIHLFNDSVKENIIFHKSGIEEKDIESAVSQAYFEPVLESLEHGYLSEIGEGGMRLSGGQRQRLALARALIGSPEILVLDEATSALDSKSESLIKERIDSISHSYTMIIVTHRLSLVSNADVIYVLKDGEVVQQGDFRTLEKEGGVFGMLLEAQSVQN